MDLIGKEASKQLGVKEKPGLAEHVHSTGLKGNVHWPGLQENVNWPGLTEHVHYTDFQENVHWPGLQENSPKVEETDILLKFIVNVPTNSFYAPQG